MLSHRFFLLALMSIYLTVGANTSVVAQTYQFRHYMGSVFTSGAGEEENGPSILTSMLPNGVLNQQYSAQVEAVSGDGSELTFLSSDKPSWMSIHPVSDAIVELSGIPLVTGTSSFSVTVTDNRSKFDSALFNISILHSPCSEVVSIGDLCEDGLIYVGTYAFTGGSYKYFMARDNFAPMAWYTSADSTRYQALGAELGPPLFDFGAGEIYQNSQDGFQAQIIMDSYSAEYPSQTSPSAIDTCGTLITQGYDDWFLPSEVLMKRLLTLSEAVLTSEPYNLVPGDTGGYHTSTLTSSTETSVSFAKVNTNQNPGLIISTPSIQLESVRCFRRMPA
ncbi:hypothetical protein [Thalassospira xiamenensis]|uniref:Dystroglycan-type cadherin-like domain-containing protein n=1 Tax=Thalassospira xiamenensis TaxID=220697 RepID=A0A285TYI5_9PROT|nr:hypothetical protein [Thalassospira xiamenensis]SOC30921.1 hypothetical protein SAMN05428964_11114 [Thalassospira xiamenensis]